MEIYSAVLLAWVSLLGIIYSVSAIDPFYLERAKILDSDELSTDGDDTEGFEASARKCRKIGERAARKRIACIADTDLYETLANRVHMSRIVADKNDQELWDLAYKISKCSLSYSKYFEHACRLRTVYLNDRRRCRRLRTRQERTLCKGEIQKKYHRRQ